MSNYSPARPPGRTDTPAGWHPDPFGRHQFRYWDGADWTNSVSDAGVGSQDPPGWREPAAADQGQAPESKRTRDSEGGFWTSLPGVLTAIAAVITAAGGILISTRDNDPAPAQLIVAAEDLGVDDQLSDQSTDSTPAYSDYMRVSDDTGTIVVEVPVEWADVNGAPYELEDGTGIPDVAASSDLGAFVETYDVPGVEVSATDVGVIDVPTAMSELAPLECTSAGSEAYDDPVFEGEIEFFTDCAGTGTIYVLLAATYKPEPERIALVQAQITAERDFDAIVRVLDTFNFTG
jgi:hypothetical protein